VNELPIEPLAPAAPPPPAVLPSPARDDRWQPLRSGVVNLYRFDYEEFHYEGGRLLLRGNNGAGKSRLLALQLPFLLDGETVPSRVEPDGDPAKRIEWNLLMGRHADRTGYTWIEFGRRETDGTERFLTLGCGLRAVAGQSGLRARWYFVTPQRIGRDLFLQNPAGQPLGRERLEESLRPAGRLFASAQDYRAAIDAELFGLGERYPRLLELLIRLRRPQLSRKLDAEELSQTLSDALPVLSTSLVEQVAESFRGLQSDREACQGFRVAREGVEAFLREYRLYARTALRRRAATVRSAHRAMEDAQRRLRDAERRAAEAQSALEQLAAIRAKRETSLAAAEAAERELRASPEMRTAEELAQASAQADTARHALAETEADERAAAGRLQTAQARLATSEASLANLVAEADQALRTVETQAHETGLLAVQQRHLPAPSVAQWTHSVDLDAAAGTLNRELQHRRRSLALVQERETAVAVARRHAEQTETRRREADAACSARREEESEARSAFDSAGEALLAAFRTWHARLAILRCPTAEELAEPFGAWLSSRDGESPLHVAADAAHREAVAHLAAAAEALRARFETEEEALRALHSERTALESGSARPPLAPETRRSARTSRPGAPLWRVCDFAPDLADPARAGLEAALESSGLLDAWLLPDGRLLDPETEDTFLCLSPGAAHTAATTTLATALVPTIDPADEAAASLSPATVAALLRSIGLGSGQGDHWVERDGSWQLGPLRGRWTKAAAEYLGESTRAQARRRRLAQLAEEIATAEQRRASLTEEQDGLRIRRQQADAELEALPSADPVRQTGFALAAAVAAVSTAFAEHEKAERAAATARDALDETIRRRETDAADCGLFAWLGRLDTLAASLADYASALAALWPTLRHHAAAAGQLAQTREAACAAEQELAHRTARRHEAASAVAAATERCRILQETHGASVESVQKRLQETVASIAQLKTAEKLAQAEEVRLTSARDTAVQNRAHAEEERGRHEENRSEAIARLQRFAEQRLFSEAAAELAAIEPAGWSATRAVEIARAIEPVLADTAAEEENWRARQDGLYGHLQELRDRLVAQGHQPETHALDDFVIVRCPFQARPHSMTELAAAFAAEVGERETLLAAREKEIIETHLLGEVAVELQRLVRAAEEWIADANTELAARPTSTGLRFRFAWETVEEGGFAALRRTFLRTSELWTPAERATLAQFLQGRIAAAQVADEDGSWRDHLSTALDYRRWHRFAVERQQDGQWRRLDRRTYGTGSGGEKALALTLPRFAAASAYYKSAARHAPRLVMLDEAFAGIDPTMRAQCLGVIAQFDLDVVMTSELEWGCYPTVPALAIYHLAAFPGIDAVGVTRWVWNGHERRRLDTPLPPDRPASES